MNGTQAEAFARYIQGHLAFVNEGADLLGDQRRRT